MKPSERLRELFKEDYAKQPHEGDNIITNLVSNINAIIDYLDEEYEKN